jgi:glycosyltransferase involved in cell wall biosynthesis
MNPENKLDRTYSIIKNPRVSVVIPCYNHATYLGEAVQSVLNQSCSDYEIIVVDDGSSDNTSQIAKSFGDQICYVYQDNAGLSAARNTGIQLARGDLIALLDADDLYEINFIKTITDHFARHPNIDGVYCGFQFVDHGNHPLPQPTGTIYSPENLYPALLKGNFFVPASMVVYKYCYETVGLFDTSLSAVEDWDRWLRISKKYNVMGISDCLVRYRIIDGSMSSNPEKMLSNRLSVIRKHFGDLSNYLEWGKVERSAYAHVYLSGLIEFIQSHNLEKAYECFRKMVIILPELVDSSDVWGELSWGDQPRGFRGDYATINIKRSEGYLLNLLDKLWRDPYILSSCTTKKYSSYANAFYSLGLRSYCGGHLRHARRYFLRAVKIDFHWMFKKELQFAFIKSLVGIRIVRWFRPHRSKLHI